MKQGSFHNQLAAQTQSKAPKVGEGATIIMWTDRRAATVISVSKSGKRCTVQEDTAIRTDKNGMSDAQSYTFERNPQGRTWDISLRKDGKWKQVGDSTVVLIGQRSHYYDYSF